MMRSLRRFVPPIIIGCALLFAAPAFAQIQDQNDYQRLQWRYDQLLRTQGPQAVESVQRGMTTERGVIRSEIERDLSAFIKMEEGSEAVDLVRVMDKQRSIVTSLNELIDGTKVDLSQLEREEEYYQQMEKTGTGAQPEIMSSKSYPELLARKAVLEERLNALQAFLGTQQDRLQKLQTEQQVRNVGLLISILTYIGIFLLVFWVERIVRNALLAHIQHRRLRYSLTKGFTFIVYVSLVFWFVQKLLSEYPGVLTVISVIGAALVFVMQDYIKGAVGWLGLRNIVTLGQRVTIGSTTGDIIDIGFLHTTLLVSRTSTMDEVGQVGKLVRIPNERILSQYVVNYHSTSDFENVEFPVSIARSDQWEQAHQIIEEVLRKETDAYAQKAQRQTDVRMRGFYYSHLSPSWRVYMELTEKREVQFVLCFPAPIGQRRAIATLIMKEILRRFAEERIDMTLSS
jgi:small-conductance mechanosensitive channel